MAQHALFALKTRASDCWCSGSVCSYWWITRYTGCQDRWSVCTTSYYTWSGSWGTPDDWAFLRYRGGRSSDSRYPVVGSFLPVLWLMTCYWSCAIQYFILSCVSLCVQFGLIRYVRVLVLIAAIIAEMKGFCYLLSILIVIGLVIVISDFV